MEFPNILNAFFRDDNFMIMNPDASDFEGLLKLSFENFLRKTYVSNNNNITRATDEYKKNNDNQYKPLFQQRMDINNIKDSVRHSNFKEQCEFYNDELKKYGVELVYITQ